jgi:hypothetical protein
MDAIEVRATLETRLSKKTGKTYQCLVIKLTDSFEKVVFLDTAEIELIKMNY